MSLKLDYSWSFARVAIIITVIVSCPLEGVFFSKDDTDIYKDNPFGHNKIWLFQSYKSTESRKFICWKSTLGCSVKLNEWKFKEWDIAPIAN